MAKHLVLAGGGHAHMEILANLGEFIKLGWRVTVIGPSDYHYYSGMGPGLLGTTYEPDDIRFATRAQVEAQGGTFVRDTIVAVDPQKRCLELASGAQVEYDLVSFNTGSSIRRPEITGDQEKIYTVKPIERLYEAREAISSQADLHPIRVAVIGGGPAGAEISGNLRELLAGSSCPAEVILYAGRRFMGRFPEAVRQKSRRLLGRAGVKIVENGYLQRIDDMHLVFDGTGGEAVDFILLATGVHPSSFFETAGMAVGRDGGLLVNRFLQHVDYPEVFGGGDCISFQERELDKVGVYAVRENPVLLHNLKAIIQGQPLQAFDPGGDYLLIFNLGQGQGVLRKRWLNMSGRLAFKVKDWIDRKFIERFK